MCIIFRWYRGLYCKSFKKYTSFLIKYINIINIKMKNRLSYYSNKLLENVKEILIIDAENSAQSVSKLLW